MEQKKNIISLNPGSSTASRRTSWPSRATRRLFGSRAGTRSTRLTSGSARGTWIRRGSSIGRWRRFEGRYRFFPRFFFRSRSAFLLQKTTTFDFHFFSPSLSRSLALLETGYTTTTEDTNITAALPTPHPKIDSLIQKKKGKKRLSHCFPPSPTASSTASAVLLAAAPPAPLSSSSSPPSSFSTTITSSESSHASSWLFSSEGCKK